MKTIEEMQSNDINNIVAIFPLSGTLDDVSGNNTVAAAKSWITNSNQPYKFTLINSQNAYNLKHGFRKITNDGGTTVVYQPCLYGEAGTADEDYPALPSGYSEISKHPAGNYHNGAETKITLENYGAKSYDEMKALAIADERFELVEDDDGNLSEIKVITSEEVDTEHYTADNNTQQTLTENTLETDITQNIALIVRGGDNPKVAASKTYEFSGGAELTVTAATSGVDGNNIRLVFVQGVTRGIAITYGATVTITLTYESGDDISDCTDELDSVMEWITYSIDTDGALSDTSGYLTGGFTPELEILGLEFCGEIYIGETCVSGTAIYNSTIYNSTIY
jgi:hypothetical protein